MGNPFRLALDNVGYLDPELRAIPEELHHLFGHHVPQDHADIGYAGIPEVLDTVLDVRLVGNRYQLLGARMCQWPQTGP